MPETHPAHPLPRRFYLNEDVSEALNFSRAVAAGLVVLLHARIHALGDMKGVWASNSPLVAQSVGLLTSWGHLAVIVFFVISGYLIGGKVLHEQRPDQHFWINYAADRFSRISIVAVPAVLLSVLLAYLTFHTLDVSYNTRQSDCLPAMGNVLANLLYLHKVVAPTVCSNGPYWSIANEVYYYALFPLLWIVLSSRSLRGRLTALFFAALLVAYAGEEKFGETGLLAYFSAWLLGALAARPLQTRDNNLKLWLLVAGCTAIALAFSGEAHLRMDLAIASLTALLFAALRVISVPAWALPAIRSRVVRRLSDSSYSLYLFHMPLMNFTRAVLEAQFGILRSPGIVNLTSVAVFIGMVVVSYAGSIVAWTIIESRTSELRRLSRQILSRMLGSRGEPTNQGQP